LLLPIRKTELKPARKPEPGKAGGPGPLSVERVLGILRSVAGDAHGKTLTELSEALATPKTSLLNLLPALTAAGYLVRSGRACRLGPAAFQLASAIRSANHDVASVAQPLLRRLAEDTGKTVTFCVLDEDERAILHIAKEESRSAMRFAVEVGSRAAAHHRRRTRHLAFRPGEWAERFLRHARLPALTEHTIVDRRLLRASVADVRARGYAMTQGETYDTIGVVAAPVFRSDGFIGAIVAAGAVEQVRAQGGELGAVVQGTVQELSHLLGYG
jgi:DNA-binding IclR family transcriptional regulator